MSNLPNIYNTNISSQISDFMITLAHCLSRRSLRMADEVVTQPLCSLGRWSVNVSCFSSSYVLHIVGMTMVVTSFSTPLLSCLSSMSMSHTDTSVDGCGSGFVREQATRMMFHSLNSRLGMMHHHIARLPGKHSTCLLH